MIWAGLALSGQCKSTWCQSVHVRVYRVINSQIPCCPAHAGNCWRFAIEMGLNGNATAVAYMGEERSWSLCRRKTQTARPSKTDLPSQALSSIVWADAEQQRHKPRWRKVAIVWDKWHCWPWPKSAYANFRTLWFCERTSQPSYVVEVCDTRWL